MASLREEIESRRTFAIISHPDAGKTTLTEKLLLYGGAIQTAGSVKGKQSAKHAVSDWMDIEKQRGISVTSSVLQFNYQGKCINILDTPGHQDFSEDTYRTLMAADSAVMVIDAAKGVGAQTIKLFKVCTLRHIPIFTFINKMDREARDPFELMENIEEILGIKTYPMNWPISCGKDFKGVYDRNAGRVLAFESDGRANGVKMVEEVEAELGDARLDDLIGAANHEKLAEDIGGRLTTIETLTGKVEERSPETVREYREKLTARMQEVLQSTTIDESRILTEAAIYADKIAVDEETVRLRSHVSQLRDMLLSDEPMGRKMDFLIQEVNRESNTIGSKCNDVAIARDVVALKAEVEKIREQVQNIE